MPTPVRSHMENAYGTDFSHVRVHTSPAANQAASALRAHAFTSGSDVVFGAGKYQPGTPSGDRLIAHELAHVVQQADGVQRAPIDGGASDPLEAQADKAAEAAVPSSVKTNEPWQSTSSDLLRQLEIYIAWRYFGGKLPAILVAPVRCLVRLFITGNVPLEVAYRSAQTVYDMYRIYENAKAGIAVNKPDAQGRYPGYDIAFNLTLNALGGLDVVDDCFGQLIVEICQLYLNGFQPAGESLWHYRQGSGADYWYDANRMLKDSVGFAQEVATVRRDKTPTPLSLTKPGWASTRWEYTFGDIDFAQATLLDDSDPHKAKVRIVIADPYQWHPDDLRVEFFHAAMENMKANGAREFMQRVNQVVEIDLT